MKAKAKITAIPTRRARGKSSPLVAVVMGSANDWEVMQKSVEILRDFAVPFEARVVSAHRTPDVCPRLRRQTRSPRRSRRHRRRRRRRPSARRHRRQNPFAGFGRSHRRHRLGRNRRPLCHRPNARRNPRRHLRRRQARRRQRRALRLPNPRRRRPRRGGQTARFPRPPSAQSPRRQTPVVIPK